MQIFGYVLAFIPILTTNPIFNVSSVRNNMTLQTIFREPSLNEIDESISLAESFVEKLYKNIDDKNAAISEYFGLPINVHFENEIRLLGQNPDIHCPKLSNDCAKTDNIELVFSALDSEEYKIRYFSKIDEVKTVVLVKVNWNFSQNMYSIRLTNLSFDNNSKNGDIYLSGKYLITFNAENVGQSFNFIFDKKDTSNLQSNRYTIRHGTQQGLDYYKSKGTHEKAEKLANYEKKFGFVPGFDIHSPIWGGAVSLPDNLVYDLKSFHDCFTDIPETFNGYEYKSKVCNASPYAYVLLSKFDTLAPTSQAIQTLNKYKAPFGNKETISKNVIPPHLIAKVMENYFDTLGFGIPLCTPVGCGKQASGIRTAQFGALETILGYKYNIPESKTYADKVASLIIRAQIDDSGLIRTKTDELYRPSQIGGVYTSWDRDINFDMAHSGIYGLIDKGFNSPGEYSGIVPSNAETMHDMLAYLFLYRCEKFKKGCEYITNGQVISKNLTSN